MPVTHDIRITYESPYSIENARQLYRAIAVAVAENWTSPFRDTLSSEVPRCPPRPDEWVDELEKAGLEEFDASLSPDQERSPPSIFDHIAFAPRVEFSFSPLSSQPIGANVERTEHGMISLYMEIYRSDIWQSRRSRATIPFHPAYRPEPGDDASYEEQRVYREWLESLPQDDVSEQNKLLLLRFLRHLATLFPVWRLEIDPRLFPDLSAFPEGPLFPVVP